MFNFGSIWQSPSVVFKTVSSSPQMTFLFHQPFGVARYRKKRRAIAGYNLCNFLVQVCNIYWRIDSPLLLFAKITITSLWQFLTTKQHPSLWCTLTSFLGDDTRHTVQYGREPSSNEGKGVSIHLVMTEEHVFLMHFWSRFGQTFYQRHFQWPSRFSIFALRPTEMCTFTFR